MDFVRLSGSVQTEAMGNAAIGLESDEAFLQNPASITTATHPRVAFQNLNYYQDLSFKSAQLIWPTQWGNFGVHVGLFDAGAQTRTTITDKMGGIDSFGARGTHIALGYGRSVGEYWVGGSLNVANESLDGGSSTAVSLDLGLLQHIDTDWSIGAAIKGLSLKKSVYAMSSASIESQVGVGISTRQMVAEKPMAIAVDVVVAENKGLGIAVGIDYKVHPMLSLRMGTNTYSDISRLAIGLGLQVDHTSVDLTYKPSEFLGASYRIGIGFEL